MTIPAKAMIDRTIRRVGVPCSLFPRAGTFTEARGVLSTRTEEDSGLSGAGLARRYRTLTLTREDGAEMQTADRVVVEGAEFAVDAVDTSTASITLILGTWREPRQ